MNTFFRGRLFIAYIGTISLASSICIPANADVVTDWNNAALDAIRAGNTSPRSPRALLLFFTRQSMTQLTALRGPMNVIWCQA